MIGTERLVLRAWRESDAAPFHAMGQDAKVMRFLGPPPTLADCAAAIERQNALAEATGSCFWAVERQADGVFIGFCGIKPGPEGTPIVGRPEIGWRLRRDAWRQGFAREAAQACLDQAWRAGRPRVFAITVPGNARSWELMERLGMRRLPDGDFDHPALAEDDPLRPHITYVIDRPLDRS